jgi:hypothetical protein
VSGRVVLWDLLCPVCYLCPFANGHFPFAPSRAQTGTLQTGCKRDIPFVFSASSVPVCTPRSRGANGHSARTQTGSSRLCCVQVSCRQFFRKRTSRLLPTRRENAAQGDSTCGERRISLALAGVGAHFCHVATSSLPKIRRAVPICVADANGQGPVCAETHLCSSTNGQCPSVGRSCGRAPRILSLSLFKILTPTLQNLHTHTRTTLFTAVGPSKARSFTESRVGAQTGHDCKAP